MKKFVLLGTLAVAALSSALAACSDNPFSGGRVPVRFVVTDRPAVEFAVDSAAPGAVAIRGTFGFSPCDTPDPEGRVEGNTVIFRLFMQDDGGGACPSEPQVRGYRADLSRIDPGTYQVRVEHVGTLDNYDGVARPDGVRFEGTATVK